MHIIRSISFVNATNGGWYNEDDVVTIQSFVSNDGRPSRSGIF